MVLNRGQLIVFGLACAAVLVYLLQYEIQESERLTQLEIKMANLIDRPSANGCQEYRQKCFALYKALRYPNIKYLFNYWLFS